MAQTIFLIFFRFCKYFSFFGVWKSETAPEIPATACFTSIKASENILQPLKKSENHFLHKKLKQPRNESRGAVLL